jgi:formylmethanofuran dehydrogenase subunit D
MKKLLLSLLLGRLFMPQAGAQKIIEKHIDFAQKDMVALNIQIADSIRILTWNKNEVYVKASIDINDNKDNDLYQTAFGDSGSNTVAVQAKMIDNGKGNRGWNEKCNCYCMQSQVYWDIYIPENANLSVESINANITITGKTAAVRAKSISGFIDLAVDPQRKADLRLNTITGTVYTDLAVAVGRNSRSVGTKISDLVNGGGKPISLETISGDIFLRKERQHL